jgi:hypothetical protein
MKAIVTVYGKDGRGKRPLQDACSRRFEAKDWDELGELLRELGGVIESVQVSVVGDLTVTKPLGVGG